MTTETTRFTLTIRPPLEAAIEELRSLLAPIRQGSGPEVLAGGRLTESLNELIEISQAEIQVLVGLLEDYLVAHTAALDAAAEP